MMLCKLTTSLSRPNERMRRHFERLSTRVEAVREGSWDVRHARVTAQEQKSSVEGEFHAVELYHSETGLGETSNQAG